MTMCAQLFSEYLIYLQKKIQHKRKITFFFFLINGISTATFAFVPREVIKCNVTFNAIFPLQFLLILHADISRKHKSTVTDLNELYTLHTAACH